MCGRYEIDEDDIPEIRAIIDEINRQTGGEAVSTGEIYPTNIAPILLADGRRTRAAAMRWGFPGVQASSMIINARAETAAQKPLFRQALLERRVVVRATGFFEWKRTGGVKGKEKYRFRRRGERMLYFAGMFSLFPQEDGSREARFTILTTAANDSISPYHDRMPVILDAREHESWLLDGGSVSRLLTQRMPELTADIREAQQQISLF